MHYRSRWCNCANSGDHDSALSYMQAAAELFRQRGQAAQEDCTRGLGGREGNDVVSFVALHKVQRYSC